MTETVVLGCLHPECRRDAVVIAAITGKRATGCSKHFAEILLIAMSTFDMWEVPKKISVESIAAPDDPKQGLKITKGSLVTWEELLDEDNIPGTRIQL